jgi:LysM repeat protein
MEEYFPAPERRYPSPSAQRRSGEHWKARFGLAFVVVLTLCSAGVLFHLAGLGVGMASNSLRGVQGAPARPTAAATVAAAAGQAPGNQPAAPPPAPTATTAAAAPSGPTATSAPGTGPTPTTRPGQREYVVQGGDTLFAIAQRNNTSIDAIVAANNLPNRNSTLSIGQKLVIP